MDFLRKTSNTGWFIGGTIIALMMILLAESSTPPRDEAPTPGTNTIQKDFRPILQNIKTIPKQLLEEKTEYQTLLVKRLSGVPEPANGPMAVLAQMEEVHMPYFEQFDISSIKVPATWDTDWLLEIIEQDPSVKHAYKEQKMQSFSVRPDDPAFGRQTNLHDPVRDVDIDAPEAWAYTTGRNSVVVAVLDSNLDTGHADLRPNLWVNSSETVNGIDDDNNGCIDDIYGCELSNIPADGNIEGNDAHGTGVSSILGARGNNGYAITGVTWNTRIMFVGGGLIGSLNYVMGMRNRGVNIKVINHSRGQEEDCNPSDLDNDDRDRRDAIRNAGQQGILFVQAIGNSGIDYNSREQATKQLDPGCHDLDNMIVVAGQSETTRTRAGFSNYGTRIGDLYAPAEGLHVAIRPSNFYPSGYQKRRSGGTSHAAPHVVAAAALLWSFKPDLTVAQVRSALLDTVDRFDTFKEVNEAGVLTDTVASGGALNIANALYSVAEPGIRIHSSQTAIAEGTNGYIDLSLTREPVRPSFGEVVVLQGTAIASPTAVAIVTPSTLTFTSSNWHIPQRMTVRAAGARGSEVRLQVSVNDQRSTTDYRTLPMQTATLTVQSDGIRPTLQIPPSIAEGDTATATIRFSDPLINAAQFTITATGAGTAVEGTDYTLPNTITATTDSASATFNIPTVVNPGYNGPDKTIHLQITTDNPLISPQTLRAILTIEDSDTPIMTITVLPSVISQSNTAATAQTATATIALDRPAVEDVMFSLHADQRRNSLDHLMNHLSDNVWPTSATIVTGGTSTDIIIHSIDEDNDPGPTYRIRLSLSLPEDAAARLGTPSQATLVTRDDDGSSDLYLRLRVFLEGAMSTETITRQTDP